MVLYRRNRVAGGTYFFTVALWDRSADVLVQHVGLLRDAFRTVRAERLFTIDAIVILPDHLHDIWTLPDGDADYSGRWRAIKSHFTRELRTSGMLLTPDNRGEYRLWQRRFLRSAQDRFGSIRFAMTPIFKGMLIISTGIQSGKTWVD